MSTADEVINCQAKFWVVCLAPQYRSGRLAR